MAEKNGLSCDITEDLSNKKAGKVIAIKCVDVSLVFFLVIHLSMRQMK